MTQNKKGWGSGKHSIRQTFSFFIMCIASVRVLHLFSYALCNSSVQPCAAAGTSQPTFVPVSLSCGSVLIVGIKKAACVFQAAFT
jgi:hypothetical protein